MRYQALLAVCSVLLVASCVQTNTVSQWSDFSKDGKGWLDFGESEDGYFRHYLNNEQIKKQGDKVEFIAKIVDTRASNGQSKFDYVLNNWEMDCQQKELRLLQVKIYGKNEELINSQNYIKENETTAIPQNSIAQKQYQFLCN